MAVGQKRDREAKRYAHQSLFIVMHLLLKSYDVIYKKKPKTILLQIMIQYVNFE